MKTLGERSYKFRCDDPNTAKYDLAFLKAYALRDFKNYLSTVICKTPTDYINMSADKMVTHFLPTGRTYTTIYNETEVLVLSDLVSGQELNCTIKDVHKCYAAKADKYRKLTTVNLQETYKPEFYKMNTKTRKKGDEKPYKVVHRKSIFSATISALTKFKPDKLKEFIYTEKKDDKYQFLKDNAKYFINKFGEERILGLVERIRQNALNKVYAKPIEFVSLTFRGYTRLTQNIIVKNKNTQSIYSAYITLSSQPTDNGKLVFPVKYSREFHGDLKRYYTKPNKQNTRVCAYTVMFVDDKIDIILSYEKQVNIATNKDVTKVIGVDVNTKHNMMVAEGGFKSEWNYDSLADYMEFNKYLEAKMARKKKLNPDCKDMNKKDSRKLKKFSDSVKGEIQRSANKLVSHTIENGCEIISMEDISNMGSSYAKMLCDLSGGLKISKISSMLQLAYIKKAVKSIADKKDIQTVLVQSHYTSQACRECGTIDRRNRLVQEEFKCIACGCTHNADTHSTTSVGDRVRVGVLRESLLNFEEGLYTPKRLGKSKIKSIVEECYSTSPTSEKSGSDKKG